MSCHGAGRSGDGNRTERPRPDAEAARTSRAGRVVADGSGGYYLAGHEDAGAAALEPGAYLVATWDPGTGDWRVLLTGPRPDVG